MITQEMIDAVIHAHNERFKAGVILESRRNNAKLSLEAALPLIRAQVLEEAAKMCDKLGEIYKYDYDSRCDDCAGEIRNLKDAV